VSSLGTRVSDVERVESWIGRALESDVVGIRSVISRDVSMIK
jgi:hypothetical protein